YNPNKPEDGVFEVGEEEGLKNLCVAWLSGDRVDNLKGVPRIGPQKAAALVDSLGLFLCWHGSSSLYLKGIEDLLPHFRSAGVSEETALNEYRCHYILRFGDNPSEIYKEFIDDQPIQDAPLGGGLQD